LNKKIAIVFIHGSGGSSNIWKNQLKLRVDYDLIALDLPSHHKSDEFPEISLDLYVDVLKKLKERLKYQKLILGGHSLGGAVIQAYYYRYQNDVAAMLLCGTGGKLRVNPFILHSLKNNYQDYLNSLPAGAFYRKTSDIIIKEYVKEASKINPEVTYNDFKMCDNFDLLEKTSSIKVPCLIIVGNKDQLTPVKYSQFFHDNIQNSELCIINDAGHMVMIEKPEQVNQCIENFIQKYFNEN